MRALLRFLRRFYRLLAPITLALAAVIGALVTHALAQPSVTDRNFLNPASDAGVGGSDLAGRLAGAGVTVRRTASIDEALAWARAGDTTLFVPAPGLVNSYTAEAFTALPSSTRLVLVDPSPAVIGWTGLPVTEAGDRWAEFPAPAGCLLPEASAAPIAGTDRHEWAGPGMASCYGGSVVQFGDVDVWMVGSADPFRNDRIGEHGNEALAAALLSAHPTVVWLDNHHRQPEPKLGPAVRNPFNQPAAKNTGGGDTGGRTVRSSMAGLFPGWVWTVLGLLLLILVVLAIAAARRFGPPVSEPMPVTAKARETVAGRGRLYRKAKQPAVALAALRAGAVRSLPAVLGVAATVPAAELYDLAAVRAGMPRDTVEAILATDEPKTNDELVAAVARLDELMARLTHSIVSTHGLDRT